MKTYELTQYEFVKVRVDHKPSDQGLHLLHKSTSTLLSEIKEHCGILHF